MTRFTEAKTGLYAIRAFSNSATVVMASDYLLGLVGLWIAFCGVVATGLVISGLTSPEDRPELLYNWPERLAGLVFGLLFVLVGGGFSKSVIDLRSITVTPGRATVVWRLFRTPIRSSSFKVQFVVIHQDVWRGRQASTDRVILQGQEQMHTLVTVWNVPHSGSFKPPYMNWPLGPASDCPAHVATNEERTVPPFVLDLAKVIAGAASVPIVHRVGKTHAPWVTIG